MNPSENRDKKNTRKKIQAFGPPKWSINLNSLAFGFAQFVAHKYVLVSKSKEEEENFPWQTIKARHNNNKKEQHT